MNILVIGAGGVGASMASIAETRSFFTEFVLADLYLSVAEKAIAELDDPSRFRALQLDARDKKAIVDAIAATLVSDAAVNRALSQWKDLTAPRPVVRTGIPATGV